MSVRVVSAVAALAAAAVVSVAVVHRRLRGELVRSRVEARLTAGCLYRDVEAFRERAEVGAVERQVVLEAGRVVDAVLAGESGRAGSERGMEGGLG